MTYDAFKVVHLFGVVLFLGNIIVTAVWKVMADRTGDPRVIAYAQRLVTLTDWMFTAGGVVLLLVGASRRFPKVIGGTIGAGWCGESSPRLCLW
jgi:uncharacterized membrane protein